MLFTAWNDLESLSPKAKLNVIAEKVSIAVDYSRRPWQTVTRLFSFRNDIAHGKTSSIIFVTVEYLEKHNLNPHRHRAETEWEKYCTKQNAERARKDVEQIVEAIHSKANIQGEYPFQFGFEIGGSTLLPE